MNELEQTMKIKEVAEILKISEDVILKKVKQLYPEIVKNGIAVRLNEFQITKIKDELSKNPHLRQSSELDNVKTTLDKKIVIAKAWQYLQEEIEALQNQNELLVSELNDKKSQIEVNKPKVEFYDAVTGSKDTIDMSEVAKILNIKGIGRNNLFEILRNKGILRDNNQPYQTFIDSGYFRLIESQYTKPDGSTHISIKTVVFQKGIDYIRKVLKEV